MWVEGRRYLGLGVLVESRVYFVGYDDRTVLDFEATLPAIAAKVHPQDHAEPGLDTIAVDVTVGWIRSRPRPPRAPGSGVTGVDGGTAEVTCQGRGMGRLMLAASALAAAGVVACSSSAATLAGSSASTSSAAPRSSSSPAPSPLPGPARPFTATSCPDAATVQKATGVNVRFDPGTVNDSPGLYCAYFEVETKPGSILHAFQVLWGGNSSLKEAFDRQAQTVAEQKRGMPGIVMGLQAAPADFGGGAFEVYGPSTEAGTFFCTVWLRGPDPNVYTISGSDARSVDATCRSAETFARLLY